MVSKLILAGDEIAKSFQILFLLRVARRELEEPRGGVRAWSLRMGIRGHLSARSADEPLR